MANIFAVAPGVAAAFIDPRVLPISFGFTGWYGFAAMSSIVRGISIASRGNYQFLNTLRNYIYVYVFGEKMGDITISGLTFIGGCHRGANFNGYTSLINYYGNYAIANTGSPIGIQIGMVGLYAFLVGVQIKLQNPEARIGQFVFHFKMIPTRS